MKDLSEDNSLLKNAQIYPGSLGEKNVSYDFLHHDIGVNRHYIIRLNDSIEFNIKSAEDSFTLATFENAVTEGLDASTRGMNAMFEHYMKESEGSGASMDGEAVLAMMNNGVILEKGILYIKSTDGGSIQFKLAGENSENRKITWQASGDAVKLVIEKRRGSIRTYEIRKGVLYE